MSTGDQVRARLLPPLAGLLTILLVGLSACGDDTSGRDTDGTPSARPTPSTFVAGPLKPCFIPRTEAVVKPASLSGKGMRLRAATFAPPDDAEPEAVMVLLHQTDGGGLCGWGEFASAAALEGVASLAFDMCGYGSASCDVADPDDPTPQVKAALAAVAKRWPNVRVVLVGASMGGSQTVRAAAAGVDVDGWVDLSGPSTWAGVDLASLADKVDIPGLVAISEETDGADETAAAEALASATGAEFVPADSGHGYEMIVDETLLVLPVGERVLAFAKAR